MKSVSILPAQAELMNSAEEMFINKIKNAYGKIIEDGEAIMYVHPKFAGINPDFILIDPNRGVSIITIKDWKLEDIKASNPRFFMIQDRRKDNPAIEVNRYVNILSNLLDNDPRLSGEDYKLKVPIISCVCFPNLSIKDLKNFDSYLKLENGKVLTNEIFSQRSISEELITRIFNNSSVKLEDYEILLIRKTLFPEILIQDRYDETQDIFDKNLMRKQIKVLDSKQEEFARKIPNGHYLIRGVPGSGKTVILITRAIHLLKENPDWKILILTYTNSLKSKLKDRLDYLVSKSNYPIDVNKINVSTFHKFCFSIAGSEIQKEKPKYADDENKFFDEVIPQISTQKANPMYDTILVDEVQDFGKEWFPLILKITKAKNGIYNILLVGDETQRIYPRKWYWKEVGLDMRGRSNILKKSYRTASNHMKLAIEFLKKDETLVKDLKEFALESGDDSEVNLNPEIENIRGQVIFLTGSDSINNFMIDRLREGYEPKDFLIIGRTRNYLNTIYHSLDYSYRDQIQFSKDIVFDKGTITTFHSVKGLENKICIVAGLNICPLDKNDDLQMERKLVYVAMTRASEILVLQSEDFSIGYAKEIYELAKKLGID